MRAPTARYRVTVPPTRVVWANDGGTITRLPGGSTVTAGDLKPDTIRTGLAEGWLEPITAKGDPAPVDKDGAPLDIDERAEPAAEERATTAEPAAPKNKARGRAPRNRKSAKD